MNATTADGYNPYRLTKDGFEWEEPAPEDPWSNIGYWGDHQIIYLLKLLEWSRDFHPNRLRALLDTSVFVHANIPYRIKSSELIKADPCNTIEFDAGLADQIRQRVESVGADGKLAHDAQGNIHHVTLVEKLLTLSLAKLSNYIPDGGIWLNTQRPEWNDANNALVGNGLSMVTTCYLHRWFAFLSDWLTEIDGEAKGFEVSEEVAQFFVRIKKVLHDHLEKRDSLDPGTRMRFVESLSDAGSEFRELLYSHGFSGKRRTVSRSECIELFEVSRQHLESSIRNNRREDGLYHAYNLLDWQGDGIRIDHLYEMLEGQVAALSSKLLAPEEACELLGSLRSSALYRENQDSYLLYPDRQLPRFLEKNCIEPDAVQNNPLVKKLFADENRMILTRDIRGGLHFSGDFRNSEDLRSALHELGDDYSHEVTSHGPELIRIFEQTFGHRQFTGRSGTFFAYEGLGSIYWHMVSKLGLAVSENFIWARASGASDAILRELGEHLNAIRNGIGAEKSPLEYGAFPSDPYSHSPENAGVKQPGMTGQVKEDVLARFAEIGVRISNGCISFCLDLFDYKELLAEEGSLRFYDLSGEVREIVVPKGCFAFTLFQVPIIYTPAKTGDATAQARPGEPAAVRVRFRDGEEQIFAGTGLDRATSQLLFARQGTIDRLECEIPEFA